MNGKLTCKMLKSVRKQIADANNIDYEPRVCHFEGNCRGTCPACEAEMRYLESQLSLRQAAGKVIKIVGLATGISAMAACSSQQTTSDSVDKTDSLVSDTCSFDDVEGIVPLSENDTMLPPPPPPEEPFVFYKFNNLLDAFPDNSLVDSTLQEEKPSSFIISAPSRDFLRTRDEDFDGDISLPERPSESFYKLGDVKEEEFEGNDIYVKISQNAQFPGGPTALAEFIRKNLVYPKSAIETHTEGTVIVEFWIEKDGSIAGVKVNRSVSCDLDREAKRIVKSMDNWIPAQNGIRKIRMKYRLPIEFKLD